MWRQVTRRKKDNLDHGNEFIFAKIWKNEFRKRNKKLRLNSLTLIEELYI